MDFFLYFRSKHTCYRYTSWRTCAVFNWCSLHGDREQEEDGEALLDSGPRNSKLTNCMQSFASELAFSLPKDRHASQRHVK